MQIFYFFGRHVAHITRGATTPELMARNTLTRGHHRSCGNHGFVLNHWEELSAGKGLAVRMIVMTKKTTYGFIVRRAAAREDGLATFSITPDSLLVRLVVAPLAVSFDPATRHVVRYEGRVPPQREVGGRLEDLDAIVDYSMLAPAYR